MSSADFDRLVRAMQHHPDLLADFKSLQGAPGRLARWAAEHGYSLTERELKELAESHRDLSDDELEQVAGGDDGWTPGPGTGTGTTGGGP